MGGAVDDTSLPEYGWEEIRRHRERTNSWLVVDGLIYDITNWSKKHPGGRKIICNWAGQDASEAWYAFHTNKPLVSKFMKTILIGRVKDDDPLQTQGKRALTEDFIQLRTLAEQRGLFTPSVLFFSLQIFQIIAFDVLGCLVMWWYGTGWIPFLVGCLLLTMSQEQAGWTQHDYGHLSVFKTPRLNHWMQIFLFGFIKGASSDWWNFRHYNHHSKPNVLNVDPDIKLDVVFLIGKVLPKEWGEKKKGKLPFQHQHKYFHFVLPPLLFPLYFNYEIPHFLITRKLWMELFWMSTFFIRWQLMFAPLLGFWGVWGMFFFVRTMESIWFVWVTQMSHLPMTVDYERGQDWVTSQLDATCNVRSDWLVDWWSGHLNFQIEHHLFPTMPRHNYHKIAPLCKSLCDKHGLDYKTKPVWTALTDVTRSLKESGQIWYDAYNM